MTSASKHTEHPTQDRPDPRSWSEQVDRMSSDDLRLLVTSMPVIEQAKGILMGHFGCEATTAFTILQRCSSVKKVKLRELAATLVEETSHDGSRPSGGERSEAVERFLRRHGVG